MNQNLHLHRALKRVRTPVVMQMELVDCGAAALSIILSYYGCSLPLEVISTECMVSREGVSIAHLVKAAHHFGLDSSVYEHIPFKNIKLPVILFWSRKHYVVLEGIKKNKIYINDPKQGKLIIDWQTFKQNFSHRVIQLQPNAQFKKNKITLWHKELRPLLQEQGRSLMVLCLGMLVLSVLNLSPLIFTKLVLDKHTQNNTPLLWGMFLVFITQLTLTYKSRQLFRRLENRFAIELSTKLVARLMQLPVRFFSFRRPVDIVYRLQAVERLAAEPWFAFCSLVTAGFQGSLALVLLSAYSPLLGFLALLICISSWLVLKWLKNRTEHTESLLKAEVRDLGMLTASYLTASSQIKAQCAELSYMKRWRGGLTQFLKHHRQYSKQQHHAQLSSSFVFSLGYSLLLAGGIYWVFANKMTFSALMACQILFLSLQDAFLHKSKLLTQRSQIEMDLQCIADITQSPIEESPKTLREVKADTSLSVQFIDVTFGYSREFKPLLQRVNLTIEAGSHIAIVGASGSGKSTLIHLLSGLYQPWSGFILINGIPLLDYSLDDRIRLLGVVSQQHFFYQGSIRDNLCLWHHYSDEELCSALQKACIDELASSSAGLDYQLHEGATNLSGGQRQRLEIARTLLAQPQILILDEATSSLDPIIEQRIKKNIMHHQFTKIVIAHRLNTIHDAEKIYMLHRGQLVDVTNKKVNGKNMLFEDLFATPG